MAIYIAEQRPCMLDEIAIDNHPCSCFCEIIEQCGHTNTANPLHRLAPIKG